MNIKFLTSAVASLALLSLGASAATIPYQNPGTIAPISLAYTATATGDIVAYFMASDAGYSSQIGILVNGVSRGIFGLPNHSSAYGDSVNFGSVNSGDIITFELQVSDIGHSWFSDPALNSDGNLNHVYTTAFTPAPGDLIPAGTYVGFEDLAGGGDLDYNDHQFVFTNITSSVPEPTSLALMGVGLVGLGLLRRRRA